MTKDRLEQLLRDRIGLAADSIGRLSLQHAVEARRAAIGAADYSAYVEVAAASVSEWDELVELLVVPETWFFRGAATYEFLGSYARDARQRWKPGVPLRILSAPCSTGEEPYSIVMTLLAEGWPLESLQVEGIDLSRRALAVAAAASYSGRAFRETTPLAGTCRTRHFRSDGDTECLDPRIRDAVRWRQANLMNPIFLPDAAPFDIVFCRNVLIYLHDEARQRVRDHLHRVLRPGGLLFLGHADPLGRGETRFEALTPTAAFAFRRRETAVPAAVPSPTPPPPHVTPPAPRSANAWNDQLAMLLKGGPVGSTQEAGTAGAGVSGAGVSGAGVSGAGVSGAGVSGAGVSGAGVSGAGPSGTGTRVAGNGVAGTGVAGTGIAGTASIRSSSAGASAQPASRSPFVPTSVRGGTSQATTLPSTTLPSTTLPSASLPSTTLPSTTLPFTTLPSATLPSATLPSATLPSATLPSATLPSAGVQRAGGAAAGNAGRNASGLVEAKRAADRGDMQAAEAHCLEALRESPPTAAAYCLLGVVLQAIGRVDEARGQFERAVYLDPEHVESLTHLMLAARRAGEFADADRYQRRAEKAQRRAAAAQSPSSGRAAEARTPEGGGR